MALLLRGKEEKIMWYEIFLQGPEAYIPILIISLLLTILGYSLFPVIFAMVRKKPISKKKYRFICYCTNLFIMIIFITINRAPSSGVPYLLWTFVFSNIGIRILEKKKILETDYKLDYKKTETYKAGHTETQEEQVQTNFVKDARTQHNGPVEKSTCSEVTTEEKEETDIRTVELQEPASAQEIIYHEETGETIAGSDSTLTENKPLIYNDKQLQHQKYNSDFENKPPKSTELDKGHRVKRAMPVVILSIVLAISIGLNVVQYIQIKDNISMMSTKETRIEELEERAYSLNNAVSKLNEKLSLFENKSGYFDELCEELSEGNIGYATSSFRASESIILVHENEINRKFTLIANWVNGGMVLVDYSSMCARVSFDNDSWSTSTTITIEPRYQGITSVTFSNSVDSNEFKVIIIVVE